MVDVTTSEAIAVRLPANDTTVDPGNTALETPGARKQAQRRERIVLLREAIERGEYRVSAAKLADAILRTRRRAN